MTAESVIGVEGPGGSGRRVTTGMIIGSTAGVFMALLFTAAFIL